MIADILDGLRVGWDLLWQGDPEALREWLLGYGAWAPLASCLLQIFSALIPILPGFVLAIANAMLYGAFVGGLLTFGTALLAAAACFGIARVAGRPGIERIVRRRTLERVDRFMERRGVLAILLGRLIPFINPDVLSYAAGATAIGWSRFLVAMAAGAVPATVLYSIVGAFSVEASSTVLFMVTAASLLPLVILWLVRDRIRWLDEWAFGTGKGEEGSGEAGELRGSGLE